MQPKYENTEFVATVQSTEISRAAAMQVGRTFSSMTPTAHQHAYAIFNAAIPVIRIHGIGGKRWKRNVARGARVGPWLQAEYDILDKGLWKARTPCLYLVAGNDGVIRYVGISRNRLADRWRVSAALDAETMKPLGSDSFSIANVGPESNKRSSACPRARTKFAALTALGFHQCSRTWDRRLRRSQRWATMARASSLALNGGCATTKGRSLCLGTWQ